MENPKIRMILCDVDGTLLPRGETVISDSAFSAIKHLVAQGIRFVVASGRTYSDLKKLFAPVFDLVTFVSNDGALAKERENILYAKEIGSYVATTFNNATTLSTQEAVVAYTPNGAYTVADVLKSEEPILKLACKNFSLNNRLKVKSFAARSKNLSQVYEDSTWLEFVPFGIDKGSAISCLQKIYGISPFETAAFGDNTNDFGMLRCARLTYASPTAIPEIKRMCKYQATNIVNELLNILEER